MDDELDGIPTFVAVAEARGFRAAGLRLGVSGSAVSQTIRRLEERLGVVLVRRTTRSVRLTEAGERLYASVAPALAEVRVAVLAVGELAERPRGMVRLSVSGSAESFLRGPTLESFAAAYPEVRLDIIVGSDPTDIVAGGFDAGIRLGEMIDQDMTAVPASGLQRLVVVGSPAYLAAHGAPAHPRELGAHACISWHAHAGAVPYRWEFTENGHDFAVAFDARIVTNDIPLMVRLARAGVGLTMLMEEVARPLIERGELVPVLEEFSTPFPGFYLYYPHRRHTSPALRALIDHVLRMRTPGLPVARSGA